MAGIKKEDSELKRLVDGLLKEKNKPFTWLVAEMKKTADGLRLSLTRGSIKYTDLLLMAEVLGVNVEIFFGKQKSIPKAPSQPKILEDIQETKKKLKELDKTIAQLTKAKKDKKG